MTLYGIQRFSPYWSFALCYGAVTAIGLMPGLLYGNEFAYWLLGYWLILPVSALLCTFWAAYHALPLYRFLPVLIGVWAIVLPFVTFGSTDRQGLFYGLVPSLIGLTLGVLVRKFVFWYRRR